MARGVSFVFLSKNKTVKKKNFSFLVKKKQAKIYKNKKLFIPKHKREKIKKNKGFIKIERKKTAKDYKIKKRKYYRRIVLNLNLQETKNEEKKKRKVFLFRLKKKLLWLKKKFYSCLSVTPLRSFFKPFRSYRLLYKNYTEASLYEKVFVATSFLGELLRFASFPVKPMHFEFCYRRCEGVLLCIPQKWYNLSLLHPTAL